MKIHFYPLTEIPKVGDKFQLKNGDYRIIIKDNHKYTTIDPDYYIVKSNWYDYIDDLMFALY